MPRARFTLRAIMIVVAVIGALCAAGVKAHQLRGFSRRCRALSEKHEYLMEYHKRGAQIAELQASVAASEASAGMKSTRQASRARENWMHEVRLTDHYARLKLKYARAARHPWLPVAPDPPEPE